jgi:hypothetical protein
MASEPRPLGSYLWNTGKDIGAAAYQEGSKAFAEVGNTTQAVLYEWSTQAAHNASARGASDLASQRVMEETAITENTKTIEPPPEISKDGPTKE